jgi:hypothetical protein
LLFPFEIEDQAWYLQKIHLNQVALLPLVWIQLLVFTEFTDKAISQNVRTAMLHI